MNDGVGDVTGPRPEGRFSPLVTSALFESERQLQEGRYHASLATLDRLRHAGALLGQELWTGLAMTKAARNRLHLEDPAGAVECLSGIPRHLLDFSPLLATQFETVRGLLARREAYALWKRSDVDEAVRLLSDALQAFRAAQLHAALGEHGFEGANAKLNELYCQGLGAAIEGRSAQANPTLVRQAILAEVEVREWSSPKLRCDIAGLTIIADLAFGARLTSDDVRATSTSTNELVACNKILGTEESSWPGLLLSAARETTTKPAQKARGLVLGATILVSGSSSPIASALVSAYLVHLQDALLLLQPEIQRETGCTHRVRRAIAELSKAGGVRFPGRRVFR